MDQKRLVVISNYPPEGATHHHAMIGGVAYAKTILTSMTKYYLEKEIPFKITVLAGKLAGSQQAYAENGIFVKRIWKRNNVLSFPRLFIEIFRNHRETKDIMLQMELSTYGGALMLAQVPLFCLALRLIDKRLLIVFHEVILDSASLSGHINIKPKSLQAFSYNIGLQYVYRSLLFLTDKAIVFDSILKQRLSRYGHSNKIAVIPIAVQESNMSLSQSEAKKKLQLPENKTIILVFGFLAWHKGTDWIIHAISQLSDQEKENLFCVIAGGPNPHHKEKKHYQRYIQSITDNSKNQPIRVTGFIPENELPLYFIASDLVIFPYRALVSSSAVLSQTFTYEKAFLLAETLRDVLKTEDIQNALRSVGLEESDLLFPLEQSGFERTLTQIKNDTNWFEKSHRLSKEIKESRSLTLITEKYIHLLL